MIDYNHEQRYNVLVYRNQYCPVPYLDELDRGIETADHVPSVPMSTSLPVDMFSGNNSVATRTFISDSNIEDQRINSDVNCQINSGGYGNGKQQEQHSTQSISRKEMDDHSDALIISTDMNNLDTKSNVQIHGPPLNKFNTAFNKGQCFVEETKQHNCEYY